MLQSRIQKQIPERLCHYTSLEALKSILSDQDGKGICFWAFSNKYKNDDQEIKMGEFMLQRILSSESSPKASLLHQFGGYENTASVSFMEGDVNQHMLDMYGHYRLEFDLRKLGIGILTDGLIDCEYVAEDELKEYADEYRDMFCNTYNSIPRLQEKYGMKSPVVLDRLTSFIAMENDIMTKVLGLKEQKWSEEKEWRKVMAFKKGAEVFEFNGKPYTKLYLKKKFLTGITVFSRPDALDKAHNDVKEIKEYISTRGYKAKVRVEVF